MTDLETMRQMLHRALIDFEIRITDYGTDLTLKFAQYSGPTFSFYDDGSLTDISIGED